MNRFRIQIAGAACAAALLAGCSQDMSDLEVYIDEVKSRTSQAVDPIPQMKPYTPYAYSADNLRSPFVPDTALEQDGGVPALSNNSLRPDTSRNKEPLEAFPLEGLRLVGTLDMMNNYFALISSPDGVVHRVTVGDYMGQNYGRITDINEAEVRIEEIVPDGFGGFVKRPARVALSEL